MNIAIVQWFDGFRRWLYVGWNKVKGIVRRLCRVEWKLSKQHVQQSKMQKEFGSCFGDMLRKEKENIASHTGLCKYSAQRKQNRVGCGGLGPKPNDESELVWASEGARPK